MRRLLLTLVLLSGCATPQPAPWLHGDDETVAATRVAVAEARAIVAEHSLSPVTPELLDAMRDFLAAGGPAMKFRQNFICELCRDIGQAERDRIINRAKR